MTESEKKKSIDKASQEMLEKACCDNVNLSFDRAESLRPCPIGEVGSCCSNCSMGPCRVPLPKGKVETPEDKRKRRGVCGATAETIAARNFVRKIAAGTAAHSDHGRSVAQLFLAAAKGEAPGYEIKDEQKLFQVALDFGVEVGKRVCRMRAQQMRLRCIAARHVCAVCHIEQRANISGRNFLHRPSASIHTTEDNGCDR